MNFLTDILVAIIASYLTFTNSVAENIDSLFNQPEDLEKPIVIEDEAESDNKISFLPSVITKSIPDILLKSAEYQQAALSSSAGLTGTTAEESIDALVNIFCTFRTTEYIRTTTGTGFFIDPDGVIMTNAHVAQFLLMEATNEYGETECVIRSGNPAAPAYNAELLYLSPAWVQQNASVLYDEVPMGTGERDYALLYVSSTVDGEPLPAKFPALDFDDSLLPVSTKNKTVTAAGYPADNLFKNGPGAELIPKSAETTVSELYTFGSNYADVFSVRGSAVGAQGASGGPVVNEEGKVIGVIVTRGDDELDGEGSLRAITLSHIARTIEEETGFSLANNLGGDLPRRSQVYSETLAPFLIRIINSQHD